MRVCAARALAWCRGAGAGPGSKQGDGTGVGLGLELKLEVWRGVSRWLMMRDADIAQGVGVVRGFLRWVGRIFVAGTGEG